MKLEKQKVERPLFQVFVKRSKELVNYMCMLE